MLYITIPAREYYDEVNNMFITNKEQKLQLEHSLVSVSKWESKWHKSFMSNDNRTYEETIDYIRCMTITQNVDPEIYKFVTDDIVEEVNKYIANPMTATWFSEDKTGRRSSETITSELIYYWMISLNIPKECEKWHLNRLLTLVRICNIKNQPPKRMSKRETSSRYAALNKARRQQLNTRG